MESGGYVRTDMLIKDFTVTATKDGGVAIKGKSPVGGAEVILTLDELCLLRNRGEGEKLAKFIECFYQDFDIREQEDADKDSKGVD